MDREQLYLTLIEKLNAEQKLLVRTITLMCDLMVDIYEHVDDYSADDLKGTVAFVKQAISGYFPGDK